MQLSAIEIEGFKSFPKRTHLTFTPGITSVIGPNGSGKSNVTEAIRWVLGEQSIKQLRGKDSQDVIFHGSEVLSAARQAKVTLTFSNESGRFPGGAAEIAITRSLSRDGESRYTINGDDVRLLDLQRSLAEAGVGVRTFTVISQGMVDRYLTATQAARKELFDEATGVRALQIRLRQAQLKLEKTKRHATEIETIIRELTPRLTVLNRQVKRYQERDGLLQKFQSMQQAWFSHRWHTIQSEIIAATAQLEALRSDITAARGKRSQLERLLIQREQDKDAQELHLRLVRAQTEYAQRLQLFEEYTTRKQALADSLAEITQEKRAAQAELDRARKTSQQYDVFSHAQTLLEQCLEYIRSAFAGKASGKQGRTIMKEIEAYLEQAKTMSAAQATRRMLDTVEGPLQEVARLSALEQERQRSLKDLVPVTKPDQAAIHDLQHQASRITTPSSQSQLTELESARDQELEAERMASAAGAALEQQERELGEIEAAILRECGSKTLQTIRTSGAPQADSVPSEADLRTVSQKLAAIGEPDPLVQKEFAEVERRHTHLTNQLADVQKAAANLVDLMGNLHVQMQKQFTKQFTIIKQTFAEMFVRLFDGGQATLAQTEEGIEISVTPPGKRSRHVSLLSGGERALTSLALLLAILQSQNPPFIVLDEVDAALDEANSRRFAQLLRSQCNQTQCLVVTHNREIMSVADVLYGVTMAQEGISSVYSVQLSDIDEATLEPQVEEMRI